MADKWKIRIELEIDSQRHSVDKAKLSLKRQIIMQNDAMYIMIMV